MRMPPCWKTWKPEVICNRLTPYEPKATDRSGTGGSEVMPKRRTRSPIAAPPASWPSFTAMVLVEVTRAFSTVIGPR